MKKYLKVKPNDGRTTHLKVEVYYSLGGMNPWTYKQEPRGYYLSVCPVERDVRPDGFTMESFTAFAGTKLLLKEVTRKSAKAEQESLRIAAGQEREMINYERKLIDYILTKHGLELESEQP